jgi:hypothetical protein
LGASPDGLVDLDSIVEIKCPFAARNTDIKTAIEKKIIKYLEIDPRNDDKILFKKMTIICTRFKVNWILPIAKNVILLYIHNVT